MYMARQYYSWSRTAFSTFGIARSNNHFRSCMKMNTSSNGSKYVVRQINGTMQQRLSSCWRCLKGKRLQFGSDSVKRNRMTSSLWKRSWSTQWNLLHCVAGKVSPMKVTPKLTIHSCPHSQTVSGYWCVLPLRLLQQATILCYQCNRQFFLEKCNNFSYSVLCYI